MKQIKVLCSQHSIKRVIERVKKIKTDKEAYTYLVDKFKRLLSGTFKNDTIRKGIGTGGGLFIGTGVHRFIYEILGKDLYKIITYHIRIEEKYMEHLLEDKLIGDIVYLKKGKIERKMIVATDKEFKKILIDIPKRYF